MRSIFGEKIGLRANLALTFSATLLLSERIRLASSFSFLSELEETLFNLAFSPVPPYVSFCRKRGD